MNKKFFHLSMTFVFFYGFCCWGQSHFKSLEELCSTHLNHLSKDSSDPKKAGALSKKKLDIIFSQIKALNLKPNQFAISPQEIDAFIEQHTPHHPKEALINLSRYSVHETKAFQKLSPSDQFEVTQDQLLTAPANTLSRTIRNIKNLSFSGPQRYQLAQILAKQKLNTLSSHIRDFDLTHSERASLAKKISLSFYSGSKTLKHRIGLFDLDLSTREELAFIHTLRELDGGGGGIFSYFKS